MSKPLPPLDDELEAWLSPERPVPAVAPERQARALRGLRRRLATESTPPPAAARPSAALSPASAIKWWFGAAGLALGIAIGVGAPPLVAWFEGAEASTASPRRDSSAVHRRGDPPADAVAGSPIDVDDRRDSPLAAAARPGSPIDAADRRVSPIDAADRRVSPIDAARRGSPLAAAARRDSPLAAAARRRSPPAVGGSPIDAVPLRRDSSPVATAADGSAPETVHVPRDGVHDRRPVGASEVTEGADSVVDGAETLLAERRMVDAALAQLRAGRPQDALESVARHERHFEHGQLVEARETVRIRALLALDRRTEARAAFDRFGARHPTSPAIGALSAAFAGQ